MVYVLNRWPTRVLTAITPYEAWIEQNPDIAHLRVFGCVGHMKVPSHLTSKLDDRSVCFINLGKEPGNKAYILYNPKEKRIHVSKDVTFEEKKAWSWEESEIGDYEQMGTFVVGDTQTDEFEDGEGNRSACNDNQPESPISQSTTQNLRVENYDDSATPKRSRQLSDVYNDTKEVILDEELYLMGRGAGELQRGSKRSKLTSSHGSWN